MNLLEIVLVVFIVGCVSYTVSSFFTYLWWRRKP